MNKSTIAKVLNRNGILPRENVILLKIMIIQNLIHSLIDLVNHKTRRIRKLRFFHRYSIKVQP